MLREVERKILGVLDEVGGFVVKDIRKRAKICFGSNAHQESGAIRAWLMDLHRAGLVEQIDEQKPAAWRRTAAGTAALND
jgi:hypothetical protein